MATVRTLEIDEIRVVVTEEGSMVLETYDLHAGEWGLVANGADEVLDVLRTLTAFAEQHAKKVG